jgi:hypothetical protein
MKWFITGKKPYAVNGYRSPLSFLGAEHECVANNAVPVESHEVPDAPADAGPIGILEDWNVDKET